MEIFLDATGSIAGATIMASVITVMQISADVGIFASASRMCWSFARDRGLPGWKFLSCVSTAMPEWQEAHRLLCRLILTLQFLHGRLSSHRSPLVLYHSSDSAHLQL